MNDGKVWFIHALCPWCLLEGQMPNLSSWRSLYIWHSPHLDFSQANAGHQGEINIVELVSIVVCQLFFRQLSSCKLCEVLLFQIHYLGPSGCAYENKSLPYVILKCFYLVLLMCFSKKHQVSNLLKKQQICLVYK